MTLFDALIDEFEDDTTRVGDEEESFTTAVVGEAIDVEEDDLDDVESVADADPNVKLDDEDLLAAVEDSESWSDDPVRMYLTQMGEIPLLTRQQEIHLARKIEVTRRRFRTKLLECDYV